VWYIVGPHKEITTHMMGDVVLRGKWPLLMLTEERIPRWQLEEGSKKHASYRENLERCWRHTLQAKPPRRGKTSTPPHLQAVQRIFTSC
jgi:hypothetical protein